MLKMCASTCVTHVCGLKNDFDLLFPRLPDFTRLLTSPPFRSPLKTTAGTLEPPLGATRLSKTDSLPELKFTEFALIHLLLIPIMTVFSLLPGVAKLICALLTTNNFEVIKSLKELKTVDVLIVSSDLF